MNLFDPKDYESITITVIAKNLTSGLEIVPPPAEKNLAGESFSLQLVEFREKGTAVFGFPKNSCSAGHNLAMTLSIKDYQQQHMMSLTGKVLSVENEQNTFSTVTVQFIQYILDDWQKFLDIYTKRQQEILSFFNTIKGEP